MSLASFSNMLLGHLAHPAMIAYLDNEEFDRPALYAAIEKGHRQQPQSRPRTAGIAYDSAAVAAIPKRTSMPLAKILTGWSYVRGGESDNGYERRHPYEPRSVHLPRRTGMSPDRFNLMGKTYAAGGRTSCRQVLLDLARIRRPRSISPSSWCGTSSPTRPPRRWSIRSSRSIPEHRRRPEGGVSRACSICRSRGLTPLDQATHTLRAHHRTISRARRALRGRPDRRSGGTARSGAATGPWEPTSPEGYSDETQPGSIPTRCACA